jgi:hypothetical protein
MTETYYLVKLINPVLQRLERRIALDPSLPRNTPRYPPRNFLCAEAQRQIRFRDGRGR